MKMREKKWERLRKTLRGKTEWGRETTVWKPNRRDFPKQNKRRNQWYWMISVHQVQKGSEKLAFDLATQRPRKM